MINGTIKQSVIHIYICMYILMYIYVYIYIVSILDMVWAHQIYIYDIYVYIYRVIQLDEP